MSEIREIEPLLHEGTNPLYDECGRLVGAYNATTGRGMFADCFFKREEPGGAGRGDDGVTRSVEP